jgi:DNA-directed RNA polymerase specialized sigma24 family protein
MIEPARTSASSVAFSAFFAENYRPAVRGAYLMTSSQAAAEDIAQDAFREVLERWDLIERPLGYLWRAVTNGARSWGRRERRPRPPLVPVGHADAIDGDVLAVRSALAGLPEGQRQALVLRHYLGLREREISEAMGCPIGTVRSHLRRGLHTMRKAMT